jgi:hypothetical protein
MCSNSALALDLTARFSVVAHSKIESDVGLCEVELDCPYTTARVAAAFHSPGRHRQWVVRQPGADAVQDTLEEKSRTIVQWREYPSIEVTNGLLLTASQHF